MNRPSRASDPSAEGSSVSEPRDVAATAATSIAQLARLTGVTPRALRYYEASGVLRATRSRSGARLFTPYQCEIAMLVVLLRRIGVGLADIQSVLSDSPVALRRLLEQEIVDVEARLQQVRQALNAMPSSSGFRLEQVGTKDVPSAFQTVLANRSS